MTLEDAKWLKYEFEPKFLGKGIRGKTLEAYLEAERILNGWDSTKRRGCSCEYRALANNVNAMFSQFKDTNQLYQDA